MWHLETCITDVFFNRESRWNRGFNPAFHKMAVKSEYSFRERTQEFLAISERLKKFIPPQSNGSSSSGTKLDGFQSAASIQSEFNKRASKIGLGIHQTSEKLSKLALCKKLIDHRLFSHRFSVRVLWFLVFSLPVSFPHHGHVPLIILASHL